MAAAIATDEHPDAVPIRVLPSAVVALIPAVREVRVFAVGESVSSDGGERISADTPGLGAYGLTAEQVEQIETLDWSTIQAR